MARKLYSVRLEANTLFPTVGAMEVGPGTNMDGFRVYQAVQSVAEDCLACGILGDRHMNSYGKARLIGYAIGIVVVILIGLWMTTHR